ncbi:MAG: TonB-dependent receptor, partial [Gemmatimonadetes bacterium]|nr:TonB-dependent receptor [Gemmatimonadota bacterium]
EGVLVVIAPGHRTTRTDRDGRFTIPNLPSGNYLLETTKAGYRPASAGPLDYSAGQGLAVEIRLDTHTFQEKVVVQPAEPSPKSGPFPAGWTREEASRISGSLDDPLRSLTALPGVAAVNDYKAEIRLRGGEPEDTVFRLDGVTLENPYHFRGAKASTAALNIDAFDQWVVKMSGLGAEVGNTVAGVVELTPTERGAASPFLEAALGSLATRITSGGALGDGGSWVVAGRYSSLELYGDRLESDRTGAPDFGDVFLRVRQPLTEHLALVAGGLGSSSSDETVEDDGASATKLEASSWMTYVGLDATVRENLHLTGRLAYTDFQQDIKDGDADPLSDDEERSAISLTATGGRPERPRWQAGLEATRIDGRIQGALESLENAVPFTGRSSRVGVFGSVFFRPTSRWTIETGARVDRDSRAGWASAQPRVRAEYWAGDWSLHLAAGRYAQFPRREQEFLAQGEPLGVSVSDELSAGVTFRLPAAVQVQVSGFVRRMRDVSAEVVNTLPGLAEAMGRFDRGQTEGLELGVRRDRGRFQSWLSFTALSAWATRDGHEFARNADQAYRLDVSGRYLIGHRWEIGGRYQLADGVPYTSYEALGDGLRELGPLNEARLPATSRLDVRATYERRWDLLRTRFYVEIINVLDQDNIRSRELEWDDDSESYELNERHSLSRVPAFGIVLTWAP